MKYWHRGIKAFSHEKMERGTWREDMVRNWARAAFISWQPVLCVEE
jgi:hypothetical protein